MANYFPQTDTEWLAICRARIDDAEAELREVAARTENVAEVSAQLQAVESKFDAIIRANAVLPLAVLQEKREAVALRTKIPKVLAHLAECEEAAVGERDAARDSLVYWTRAGLRVAR